MRLESGTCNVCSAPCSSCMHLNHAFRGSKAEEFSDENCRLEEANNRYSMNEDNVSSRRSRTCESLQHAISETSNILSVNSSHDSLSENAESGQDLSNKYQDSKSLDGHDDNTSCISRASDASLGNNSHQINEDRVNMSCSLASDSNLGAGGSGNAPSVDVSGLSGIPSSKDADSGHTPKVQSLNGQSQADKTFSGHARLIHLERDLCFHIPEISECSIENSNSSLTKQRAPIADSCEKSIANNDSLIDHASKVSPKLGPKSEANTDSDICYVKDEDRKHSVHDAQHEKAEELIRSPGMQEPQCEDQSDESDVVEHDVKVCDICGDAGREDLLAICSRCSDGAEHTYCMREMLQKVPEGDWLCEECKHAEEIDNLKLDVEEKKIHKVSSTLQVSGKRISENIEVASAAKRQALESSTGSPKVSSPKRLAQLSRESSFRSLDKGKVKPTHQMPIRTHPSGDDNKEIARSPSVGPRCQISKSTLLKSNSFNNFNSKPRVKLVDEVVPQKPKGGGEHTSKNMEIPSRMTGKSALFKSSSLGRSNATESKLKMVSPKSATAQEFKGSRHLKESGASDRKFLSRIDRPLASSSVASSVVSTPKGDQKLTPRGENTKPSAVNNNRDLKINQDGKFSALSKSTSNISRKTLEPQVSSEKISTSVDEAPEEVLPQSRETANQVEKNRDSSSDHMRPVVTSTSKSPFCQKCNEFGHSLERCTAGSTQESGTEVSVTASSSSKDEMHKDNGLKAAIQAALLRRPEIYKKKEVVNQMDEVSTLDTDLNCEVTLLDQVLVSTTLKISISAEESHEQQEIPESFTCNSPKCMSANDLKELNSCPTSFCSQPGGSDSVGLAAGKPVVRDLPNRALAISSVLSKTSAIPEYEYIWEGVFEVHRNGKPSDLCSGIQAHLSSCASPKVLEVVNKFLPKLPLNEVSCMSIWPSQFQGVAREDNIALYFFAKDIESYQRHYKGLLDHMIRNDLALRGIFDGVELLIFSSNKLPENSQRWNMLFFLWGVFKRRRINNLDTPKNICIPSLNAIPAEKDSSIAVVTLSKTHCLPKCSDEESIVCDKACDEFLPYTSVDHGQIMVSRNIDINDQTRLGSQVNSEKQDSRFDSKSTSRVQASSILLFQEMKSAGSSLKSSVLEDGPCNLSKTPLAMETNMSSRILETKTDSGISVQQDNALSSGIPSVGNQGGCAMNNIAKDKILKRMDSGENQLRTKRKQDEDDQYIDLEAAIGDQGGEGDAAINVSKDKISERMNDDTDQQRPKRKQRGDDDDCIDLEAAVSDQEGGAASNISKDQNLERMDGDEGLRRHKRKLKDDEAYIDLEASVGNQEKGTASNTGKNRICEAKDIDENQQWPKRKQRENAYYIDLEATFQGDPTVDEISSQLPNNKVAQNVDLSDTCMQACGISCQKMPWNEVNGKLEDGGSSSKKLKTGFGGIDGSWSCGGRDSFNGSFASLANDLGCCSSVEDIRCDEACNEKIIHEDLGTMERTFFPVGTENINNSELEPNSMSLKGPQQCEDRFQDGVPNLELALGGKTKPPLPPKGMLPFFVGAADRKSRQEKLPDDGQEEDDGDAASLSLSLSFPSSNKEHTKAELGHPVNAPFLLFGRFTDK